MDRLNANVGVVLIEDVDENKVIDKNAVAVDLPAPTTVAPALQAAERYPTQSCRNVVGNQLYDGFLNYNEAEPAFLHLANA